MVCQQALPFLGTVGAWYHDFTQTSDTEVTALLAQTARTASPHRPPAASRPLSER